MRLKTASRGWTVGGVLMPMIDAVVLTALASSFATWWVCRWSYRRLFGSAIKQVIVLLELIETLAAHMSQTAELAEVRERLRAVARRLSRGSEWL